MTIDEYAVAFAKKERDKRWDTFAAAALTGLLASDLDHQYTTNDIVEYANDIADKMIGDV